MSLLTTAEVSPLRPGAGQVLLPVLLTASVRRERRSRCAKCRTRRVLYRIVVLGNYSSDATEARCAPCWGIRA